MKFNRNDQVKWNGEIYEFGYYNANRDIIYRPGETDKANRYITVLVEELQASGKQLLKGNE